MLSNVPPGKIRLSIPRLSVSDFTRGVVLEYNRQQPVCCADLPSYLPQGSNVDNVQDENKRGPGNAANIWIAIRVRLSYIFRRQLDFHD